MHAAYILPKNIQKQVNDLPKNGNPIDDWWNITNIRTVINYIPPGWEVRTGKEARNHTLWQSNMKPPLFFR